MSKSAKGVIPSIFYRGPENFVNIIGTSRTNYVFSRETDYTVEPVTWEDFYEILLVDRYNVRDRLFVLADDPTKATNLRRVAPEEVEIPQHLYDAQAETDAVSKKKTELLRLKNEYIGRINLQIAHGSLDAIPEKLEEDAEAYADAQYASQVAEAVVTEDVVVATTIETTHVVGDPVVDTPTETPVVTIPDTPVETVPSVETPVVETPEVLENVPTPSVDPVTEPTDVVATDAPVVENPVETPSDTTETPTETPSEVKVETPVEETPVQAGPTTRKRSS